jgi:hypothetical protein
MSTLDSRTSAAFNIRLALLFLGTLMLLILPLQRAHCSLSHFRTAEVRRYVMRHTLLERTAQGTTVEEAREPVDTFRRLLDDGYESAPAFKPAVAPAIPVRQFMTRLKLGSSRAGSQDPLLS